MFGSFPAGSFEFRRGPFGNDIEGGDVDSHPRQRHRRRRLRAPSRSRLTTGSAAMPDALASRAQAVASILKSRIELDELRCQLREVMARGHDTIAQSRTLLLRADELLTQR